MNWSEFEAEIKRLLDQINFQPNYIAGIVRGGLVPARMLSSYLNIPHLFCMNVEKVGEKRRVISSVDWPLKNKTVLLVEDMLETGKSLMVAKKWLEDQGAQVKTACLYTMPISECTPDFYLNQVSQVITFPWEHNS